MTSYLVTGGAGFIGSHLADELLSRGHRVRVADDLSTGDRRNVSSRAELLVGDLASFSFAQAAVADMDIVLHQAAMPSVPASVSDPIRSNEANLVATLNLLVASRGANVKRFVYAGSASVIGDARALPSPEEAPFNPRSPYAAQKLSSELYCRMFAKLYGLETVTLRYFNVFGPRQNASSSYSGVISLFATALIEGRRPVIYGDGEQTRDFAYVANVVDGVLRSCVTENISGHVINIATGSRTSLNTLLRVLNEILETDIVPVYAEPRAGDVRDSHADISKARALLRYTPSVSLTEGLRRTIEWYRSARMSRHDTPEPYAAPSPAR